VFAELGSFDAYVEWSYRNPRTSQKRFFYSPEGELLIDFVGKFENLENDFQYICSKINVRETLPLLISTYFSTVFPD
jgi:hypothetical protein